jgi:hypothetical protein
MGRDHGEDDPRPARNAELLDSTEAGRHLGLGLDDPTGARGMRTIWQYRRLYPDFPKPWRERNRYVLWLKKDLDAWRAEHPPARRKTDGS